MAAISNRATAAIGELHVMGVELDLRCAVNLLQVRVASLLLNPGGRPNRIDGTDARDIVLEAAAASTAVLRLVLDHGGDPNAAREADSALTIALCHNNRDSMKSIIDRNADPDKPITLDGMTARRYAVQNGMNWATALFDGLV